MAERDYTIVGPGGREMTITGPDGATADQLRTAAEKAFGSSPAPSLGGMVKQQAGNLVAGAVRGAGSIGATIMAPIDYATDYIKGDRGKTLSSLVTGLEKPSRNAERRADMDAALRSMGADTDSLAYGAGKLTGEIAGTAGAGGAVANMLGRVPGVAAAAPNVLQAIRTSGMSAGAATGPANMLARMAGGGVAGGVSAGMVNPDDAGTGAAVGAALPGVLKVAGAVGNKVGSVVRGPAQPADLTAAIDAARQSGYVIPPSQAKPSLLNSALEGFSGKITTAQNASAKNQGVTNKLAAESLGLAVDTKLTPDVLTNIRQQAGQAFEALRNTGTVQADQTYDQALNAIVAKYKGAAGGFPGLAKPEVESLITNLRQPLFPSDAAVDAVRVLREKADAAYGAGDKGLGKAIKEAATALEDQLDRHLAATGQPASVLADFRDARKLIAKTYTVEGALNKETGTVSAQKLAAQLNKGKPLSGGLEDAARFAARFPKASQAVEGMGSLPQSSPLDWALGGSLAATTANPLALASVMARPAARALSLSPMVQNRMTQQGGPNALARLLANPDLAQLGYRAAPATLTERR